MRDPGCRASAQKRAIAAAAAKSQVGVWSSGRCAVEQIAFRALTPGLAGPVRCTHAPAAGCRPPAFPSPAVGEASGSHTAPPQHSRQAGRQTTAALRRFPCMTFVFARRALCCAVGGAAAGRVPQPHHAARPRLNAYITIKKVSNTALAALQHLTRSNGQDQRGVANDIASSVCSCFGCAPTFANMTV